MAAKFCGGCGKALSEGARFCTRCGQPVVAVTARETTPEPPVETARSAPPQQPLEAREEAIAGQAPAEAPADANSWEVERSRPAWLVPAVIAAAGLAALLAIVAVFLSMSGDDGGEGRGDRADANDAPAAVGGPDADAAAAETLYVLRQTNMRDRPTSQGSAVLASWSRGDQVAGTWVTGADPTTRWLRVVQPDGGIGFIWEGNLHTELIAERYPGIVSHDCQGEGCFVGGVRYLTRSVRLYGDRFQWNDSTHDFGLDAPNNARVDVVERIVVTWPAGSAVLTCDGPQSTWRADRSWRLGGQPRSSYLAAGTPIETLYYLGEGFIAGRASNPNGDPDREDRVSVSQDCLVRRSEPATEDWISVRLPDGRVGWTREVGAIRCSNIYDDDPRCANLDN